MAVCAGAVSTDAIMVSAHSQHTAGLKTTCSLFHSVKKLVSPTLWWGLPLVKLWHPHNNKGETGDRAANYPPHVAFCHS